MKKIKLILALAFVTSIGFANESIIVKTKHTQSTVFLKGAQIFREGRVNLEKGNTKLVIDNVTPTLNTESVQATSTNSYTILDVKHHVDKEWVEKKWTGKEDRKERKLKRVRDSLHLATLLTQKSKMQLNYLEKEVKLLLENPLKVTRGFNDTLPEMVGRFEFYQSMLNRLEEKIYTSKIKLWKEQKKVDRLRRRKGVLEKDLNVAKGGSWIRRHQLILTVNSKRRLTNVPVKVSYVINNAGWFPSYDLRGGAKRDSLTLTYKANIYQGTSEVWKGVKIKLSTFNPMNCNLKPELPVWVWGEEYKQQRKFNLKHKGHSGYNITSNSALPLSEKSLFNGVTYASSNSNLVVGRRVDKHPSFINVEFDLKGRYTVAPGNDPQILLVKNDKIACGYKHYIVPKLDQQSYLVAQVGNWEQYNLLNGEANIYFNNTYLGKTLIDVWKPSGKLEISMGRDSKLFAVRKKVEDKTKRGLNTKKYRTITIQIELTNKSKSEMTFEVNDQIPISKKASKEVVLTNDFKGRRTEKTGMLSWDVTVPPKSTKVLEFSYKVEL